ncbi:low temperature requirement protein A [Micromonospora sp. NPDC050397]|uniref:low temperature requirement protein A n=1 Tax=Micromonospora sp. NPDC050397 TaxID=3364279 RepID=UPI00384D5C2A
MLALALPVGLWWTYFTDTGAAEKALAGAEDGPRSRLAIRIGFTHVPLLLGIVITAAGIHAVVAHPGHHSSWGSALALAGGVALYLVGVATTRLAVPAGPPWSRLVTATLVLATVPVGSFGTSALHLVAVVAVLTAMLLLDRLRGARTTAPPTLTEGPRKETAHGGRQPR